LQKNTDTIFDTNVLAVLYSALQAFVQHSTDAF